MAARGGVGVANDTETDAFGFFESPGQSANTCDDCNCWKDREGDWLGEEHLLGFHESVVDRFLYHPRGGGLVRDVMRNNEDAKRARFIISHR